MEFSEAIRFLGEQCGEHAKMMRDARWLPLPGRRAEHEERELGICEALTAINEHVQMLESENKALHGELQARDLGEDEVDLQGEEATDEDLGQPIHPDIEDETEAMEKFEKAQEEPSHPAPEAGCSKCETGAQSSDEGVGLE
jgi:hypothetical protein